MKLSARLSWFLVVLLCLPTVPCFSQQANECDLLRNKIQQLERLELNAMSASMQQLYKESLLKLYTQFSRCIDQEISIATEMQKAVASTEAAPAVEDKLRSLIKEKSDTDGKITVLRTSLNIADQQSATEPITPTSAPASSSSVTASESGAGNGASIRSSSASLPGASATVVPQCAPSATYETAPEILKVLAERSANDVVNENNPDKAIVGGPQLVFYTILDSASSKSSELLHNLEAYEYLGETARTDKQLGGSGNSNGAVSSIEKPGFAQLLGFALEHGGITKANDGTNLTLSTSLYSLYTLSSKNTAANYSRAGILNRVGVAATFAVDNKDNELANARRNNLSEWSAKIRLFGDRSTRSPGFQKVYHEKIKPLIRERLRTLGRSIDELASRKDDLIGGNEDRSKVYNDLENAALDELPNVVKARMACADYTSATTQQKQQMIAAVILGRLRSAVYEPVSAGRLAFGPDELGRIEGEFLPNLKNALDKLVLADKTLAQAMEDLQKGPLATFAYTNHRIPTASDYSEAKFLFEQEKGFMGPLKLSGNLGVSLYHRPDRSLNQQKLRNLFAALSFEGASDSPFTEAENRSKITYSFVGRYERLFENRRMANRTPDIGALQFVMEIPLFKGLSLPLSVTYSTATEEEKKQGFRFNFGTRFDMDKLVELLRAGSNP